MKKLKLFTLLCLGALFVASNSYGQANPFINVLPSNSGIVSVGGTIDIIVTIGNTGPLSPVAQAKLRPIIQVPASVVFLPNAQQIGLPPGWTILQNTGTQLRICNSTDPIPVNTSRIITLKAQGVTVAPPQTFSGNINFGNGTTCAAGTSVAGDLTTDNSALSTIEVVAAGATISATTIPNACNGQQAAQINATVSGLTGTLTWSLNPAVGTNNNTGTFQNLSAGTYTVTVTNGSASTNTTVTLTDPPVFSNTRSFVSPSCNNGTNGSITVTSTGGTPYSGSPGPYIVQLWQGTPSSGTQLSAAASTGSTTFSSLGAGQYFVRCLDSNACVDTLFNITLANPTAISFTATATQINCAGGTGSATLAATGGTGAIAYTQGAATVTSPITGLAAGAYTFTATDANSCTASSTINITAPSAVALTASSINAQCNGGNGSLTFSATGGTGTITYTVNGTTATSPASRPAGSYTIVATDANSCSANTGLSIAEPTAVALTASSTNALCNGGNGSLTFSATGGTGTITYTVNGTTATSPASRPAGSYTIVATDANSCSTNTVLSITAPTAVALTASSTNAQCNGGNGSLTFSATDGTGTITYTVNGTTATSPASRPAGSYTIVATDANSCSANTGLSIAEPTAVALTASSTNALCNGGNGSLTFSAMGGTGTIAYTVNGSTATSPASRPAGSYTIVATDANSCSTNTVLSIAEPTSVALTASSTNALCNGGNGSLTFSATGGTGTIAYTVNGTTATSPASRPAGSYTIVATDANSCSANTVLSIAEPTAIALTASSTNALCNEVNGTLTFSASGGTGAISFSVNGTSATSPAIRTAGNYTIIATDVNSCTASTVLTITVPTPIVISKTIVSLPSCATTNGVVVVGATGGNGPLIYSSPVINASGTFTLACSNQPYAINVTDGACSALDSIELACVAPITLTASIDSAIECNGGVTSISAAGGGGTSYTYTLSGASSSTNASGTFTNLSAGVYTVTVAGNGNLACTSSVAISIAEPSAIVITPTVVNPQCGAGTTGTIAVSVSGGTPASSAPFYTILINGNPIQATYPIGCDTIQVTDANGCLAEDVACIIATANLGVQANASPLEVCEGEGVTFAGSNTQSNALSYAWSNGSTGAQPQDGIPFAVYQSATYTVTGTDGTCSETATVSITVNPNPVLSLSALQPKCGGDLGEISFSVSGGLASYFTTYMGSTSALASPIVNLNANTYTLTTIDQNGCMDTSSIVIDAAPTQLVVTGIVEQPACAIDTIGEVTVSIAGGISPFNITIDGSAPTAFYGIGCHTISVTDANACIDTAIVCVIAAPSLGVVANVSQDSFCAGAAVSFTGSNTSNAILTYTWSSPNANVPVEGTPIQVYQTGVYTVSGTDGTCTETSTVEITLLQSPSLTLTATQPKCFGENGEIAFAVSNGMLPYNTTMLGNSSSLSSPVTGLATSGYTLVTSDVNGCMDTADVTIDAAPSQLLNTFTISNPTCATDTVGQIAVTANGGTPALTTTIDNAPLAANYSIGTHIITTIDGNLCEASDTVEIIAAPSFGVQANASALTTCAGTAITFTGSNTQNLALTYTWSNGIQDSIPYVVPFTTTYTVTGTSGTCAETSVITITTNTDTAQLAQSAAANDSSLAGNACSSSLLQPDGSTINFGDASCNLIATVRDYAGIDLGNVSACVQVAAAVPTWNGQPYVARTYTITPTNQGPADVTLYYTNDDILDYNNYIINNNSSFPQFALPSNPRNEDSFTVCITKLNGGGLGVGTVDAVIQAQMRWNAAMNRWEVTFPVTGFSSFFCHTCNPGNIPLQLNLVEFSGRKETNHNVLNWVTSSEQDSKAFNVLYSADGNNFVPIATVPSKAVGGTSNTALSYQAVHTKPAMGHNHYKLQQIALDNSVTYSNTIDIVWNFDGASVFVYPNPANNTLHIDVNIDKNTTASIFIYDATGKLVKQIEKDLLKGLSSNSVDLADFASGVYLLKVTDGRGLKFSQQFQKL